MLTCPSRSPGLRALPCVGGRVRTYILSARLLRHTRIGSRGPTGRPLPLEAALAFTNSPSPPSRPPSQRRAWHRRGWSARGGLRPLLPVARHRGGTCRSRPTRHAPLRRLVPPAPALTPSSSLHSIRRATGPPNAPCNGEPSTADTTLIILRTRQATHHLPTVLAGAIQRGGIGSISKSRGHPSTLDAVQQTSRPSFQLIFAFGFLLPFPRALVRDAAVLDPLFRICPWMPR